MTDYEKKIDFIVAQLLTNASLDFTMNGSQIEEINEALKTSSKRGTGKTGFPEFVAQSGEFIIVIEDKADQTKQAKYIKFNGERMKRQSIMLPVNSEGDPDYVFMENYMKRKEMEMQKRYVERIER